MHVVLNSVLEDSRVLKCAWSLGNAGWDVLVAGSRPGHRDDIFHIGYAKIVRVHLKIVVNQTKLAFILRALRYYKRRFQIKFLPAKEPGIPNLARALSTLKPIALDFKPDVIHAHDYTALPIAAALIEALAKQGHSSQLIYDAHEYVPGVSHLNAALRKVYVRAERAVSAQASAVLSVILMGNYMYGGCRCQRFIRSVERIQQVMNPAQNRRSPGALAQSMNSLHASLFNFVINYYLIYILPSGNYRNMASQLFVRW